MNYPKCEGEGEGEGCKFINEGGQKTLLYSPLVYDSDGRLVGGGRNNVGIGVRCLTCNKRFYSTQTEFDDASGKARNWKEV